MTTPNFGWTLPVVAGSTNIWGTIVNDMLGDPGSVVPNIDADLQTVKDTADATTIVANAALPRAGGIMTGLLEEHSATLKTVDLAAASGSVAMNLALANFFLAQPVAATATQYVFSNVPAIADVASIVFLQVLAGGASIVTWDAAIIWPSAIIPALSTLGTDIVGLVTPDQGTTWYGSLAQRDVR